MNAPTNQQYLRRAGLLVLPPPLDLSELGSGEAGQSAATSVTTAKALDLSAMHFKFQISQQDAESPNNASIRVYNLSEPTAQRVQREFTRVVVSAGYEGSAYGALFDGTIKQFRKGRESTTDTFLDILAADGDLGYNFGAVNATLGAGSNVRQRIEAITKEMGFNQGFLPDFTGINPQTLSRGKVLFGMGRAYMRGAANSIGATWSIQNGAVQVLELTGYLPGEAVVINSLSGMIGIPEQTQDGIKVRCLINPRLKVGGLVRLNNKDITRLTQQNKNDPVPFNQWVGIQYAAKIADGADGTYRVYVIDHTGDSRGQEWYSDLVCLALQPTTNEVKAYG